VQAAISSHPAQYLADGRSRLCFDFFRGAVAREFSRHSDASFWGGSVLQVAHDSRPVRHAVLAVAALRRSRDARSHTPFAPFAEAEYSRALRDMAAEISDGGPNAALNAITCAILFIAFEVLRENEIGALGHLESAIRILGQTQKGDWRQESMRVRVVRLLARLDLDASLYLGVRAPGLPVSELSSKVGTDELEHLLDAANLLLRRATYFKRAIADDYRYRQLGDAPIQALDQQNQFLEEYRLMESRLRTLGGLDYNEDQRRRISLQQIQVKMGLTMMHGCLHREESLYDAFEGTFGEIVQICEEILMQDASASESAFTLERGLIHPLYWTASKCRNPSLRRRALELLRRCPREGVWIAEIQARVAERVIEIEEQPIARFHGHGVSENLGLGYGGVHEFLRIHSADLTFDKMQRVIYMTYQTCPNGLDGYWHVSLEALKY